MPQVLLKLSYSLLGYSHISFGGKHAVVGFRHAVSDVSLPIVGLKLSHRHVFLLDVNLRLPLTEIRYELRERDIA